MQLNALLSATDLRLLVQELVPLKIDLDGNQGERLIVLDELVALTLVPNQGIRLEMGGKIIWPVMGVAVTVRLKSLQILVHLSHEMRPNAHLIIQLTVEKSDLAWIPGVVDQNIADRVNQELRQRDFEVAWDFEDLLTHTFALPDNLRCTEALSLLVNASEFHVGEETIALGIKLGTRAQRRAC